MEPEKLEMLAAVAAARFAEMPPHVQAALESEGFWLGMEELGPGEELNEEQDEVMRALGLPI